MSNYSLVRDAPPHGYKVVESKRTHFASATSRTHMKSWPGDVLVIVGGLSALTFFVAQGGMFALLGPGVIYLGILSIRKRAGPGRQILCIITGTAMCCLSAALLLTPAQTKLWCVAGGILGLLTGLSYIASVFSGRRKI